jgi:hypothetical protein
VDFSAFGIVCGLVLACCYSPCRSFETEICPALDFPGIDIYMGWEMVVWGISSFMFSENNTFKYYLSTSLLL